MSSIALAIATWFGCGFAPKGPGTAGSFAAILIAAAAGRWGNAQPWHFALLAVLLLAPSVWAADLTARVRNLKDPQIVVVDEVLGQWFALAGARTLDWPYLLGAFALFRLFDIWKPPPVRRLEHLPGGVGIVADDVMAGFYASLVLWLAGWFNF